AGFGQRCLARAEALPCSRGMPGVATSTSWPCGKVAMPSSRWRVVCGRLEVMLTLAPTRALTRVDLPTLGRPMTATVPAWWGGGVMGGIVEPSHARLVAASAAPTRREHLARLAPLPQGATRAADHGSALQELFEDGFGGALFGGAAGAGFAFGGQRRFGQGAGDVEGLVVLVAGLGQ